MTKQESAPPQPFMPDQMNDPPCPMQHAVSKDSFNVRGYSDSVVPTSRATVHNNQKILHLATGLQNALAAEGTYGPTDTPVHNMKTRLPFQLPSFQALGIASRTPDAPLTPPDESIIHFQELSRPTFISRTSSFPPSSMSKHPVTEHPHLAPLRVNELPTADASGRTQSATPTAEAEATGEGREDESEGSMSSSSDEDGLPPEQARWLLEAANAVGKSQVFSPTAKDTQLKSLVSKIDLSTMGTMIHVMCHTQPCPLSNTTVDAPTTPNVTSAFAGLVSAIQNKIDSTGRWIDIVHAVPLRFSMAQIPTSPASTPNVQNQPSGYFDNVFSKAVAAIDQYDTQNSSVPSSPRPIVAPASINVSLLERFIPPSSAEEYLNLLTTDGPSVLVNRLIELSPQSGSLVFIYPTSIGAQTFATTYLGPLLHPLLRTMVSIHSLSMDFGAGVGKIAAVDQMLPFENMNRKLQILLRRLGRGTSTAQRTAPKFILIESSRQVVQIDREVWTEWWIQQETGRIRTVVQRYLERGVMLPVGKDVTGAPLVQEVLDGVRSRKYADYDAPRDGVEVGVFVIKRTA